MANGFIFKLVCCLTILDCWNVTHSLCFLSAVLIFFCGA